MSNYDQKTMPQVGDGDIKIQPHDVARDQQVENTPGLGSAPTLQDSQKAQADPMGGRGNQPYIPNKDLLSNLEQPKGRDELRMRQEALNTPSGEGNEGEL
ncbi:hypothetical protein JCM8202_002377 [Rhodotorula sphaerocarpa]